MNVQEAKDFLVNQTAQQAAIDAVPLSDLEKRMMYFTESDPACDDPIALNNEFEAQYKTEEYEPKIACLLKHASGRIKKENPEQKRLWDGAIRELRKGDHYILVMWDASSSAERPPHGQLKLLGTAIAVCCAMFALAFFSDRLSQRFPQFPIPGWLVRRLVLWSAVGYFGWKYFKRR